MPAKAAEEARGRPLAHVVLEMIWQQSQISRADIARQAGISRSTVSEIVSDLLDSGLVAETGDGPSRGGRRPILLSFTYSAHVIVGVDIGSSHVSIVLTDLRGRVLDWEHRAHAVREDPEGTARLVIELCDACLKRHEGARKRLLGVGVAVPSPVDLVRPTQVSDVLLPHWRGYGITEELELVYGVPAVMDNDANLGALGEHWWGAGRGLTDFAYIKLGTGVGSGHMIGGEIYRGANGVAGEIGHVVVAPDGRPCVCGNRGCLETLVGTRALQERVGQLRSGFPESLLGDGPITIDRIEEAALQGDALALAVVDETADYLSSAIATTLNLLNPSAVILGGSLSRLGALLLGPVRKGIRSRTLVNAATARILAAELGAHAIARGAATLVLDLALAEPARIFPALRSA